MRPFILSSMLAVSALVGFDLVVQAQETAVVVKAVEVGNKVCPVSGEKIGDMGAAGRVEYKGKIYNLCCPMCEGDFNKDPEKFSKIADDEVAKAKAE